MRSENMHKCSKCGANLESNEVVCPNCGDKKGLSTASSSPESSVGVIGCGLVILAVLAIGVGVGLKSCANYFSQDAREQRRDSRYQECIEKAKNSLKDACGVNACYVGCQIEFLDDPVAISNCLTNCENKTWNERVEYCEDQKGIVEARAYLGCER